MRIDLTKYNQEKVMEMFKDTKGINFAVGNAYYSDVMRIEVESGHMMYGDPDPEVGYDGGGEDYIDIKFNFEGGGIACVSFCPDSEHCEITKEMDDLWVFRIEPIPDYVAREKDMLDYKLKEYEEYMKV
ncbi:MAG: hypothetical protein ACM3TR_20110 [Caulobacteraceae bacterium]